MMESPIILQLMANFNLCSAVVPGEGFVELARAIEEIPGILLQKARIVRVLVQRFDPSGISASLQRREREERQLREVRPVIRQIRPNFTKTGYRFVR
jgi:hypothetical protein